MNTLDWLAACKRKFGVESDYALAKRLGVSTQTISSYRTGRSRLDDAMALTIALALEVDPIIVSASVNAERATTPEKRARWEGLFAGFRYLLSPAKFDGVERRRFGRVTLSAIAG